MAIVILSTIYLGVLIVDGLLLVTRNLYMYLLWTQNSLLGTMEHLEQLVEVTNFPVHSNGGL
jgi:hypothetical protein